MLGGWRLGWRCGERRRVCRFGAERCLFGSNFPIEKIWTDYNSLIKAFMDGTVDLGKDVQRQLFFDNAVRVYRLKL